MVLRGSPVGIVRQEPYVSSSNHRNPRLQESDLLNCIANGWYCSLVLVRFSRVRC